MIGSLMYIAVMTRPDISYAVSTLSQYLEMPHTTHLTAVRRVFAYLSGTKDLKLVLGGKDPGLIGFSDADWASNLHRHSISGLALFVGCGTVSWSAKKQHLITLSSTELEYVALTHASKEVIWVHKLLRELSFFISYTLPVRVQLIFQRIQSFMLEQSISTCTFTLFVKLSLKVISRFSIALPTR